MKKDYQGPLYAPHPDLTKIDTQGMSGEGTSFLKEGCNNPSPFQPVILNVYSERDREELKQILREVLLEFVES